MIPFCVSALNTSWWKQWARESNKNVPVSHKGFLGSLKTLEPYVGKRHSAALTQMGFIFDEHFEIPGVGLVLLDQNPAQTLYFGQASALHWLSLDDPKINNSLRSLGVLQWWT